MGFPHGVEKIIESAEAMEAFGRGVGQDLRGGEVFALIGGLGAGKTHFTKGLASGLGHAGEVTSPTFGLVHEYRGGRIPLLHLDFYRLKAAEELVELGWDDLLEEGGVVVAEWADRFPEMLPPETRWIKLDVLDESRRKVTFPG